MATNQKQNDPWHFSHLGERYFLQISSFFGSKIIENDLIDDLYIGHKGRPYIEKPINWHVNPNWCVRLKSGEECKSRTVKRKLLKPGLWDTNRCNQFKWTEIVDFYK